MPPEQEAECVASLEEGLETSAKAYDPQPPVLCMDAQPFQLLQETRVPIAATSKHGKRVDDAYERHGTASLCMFAQPWSGFRQAKARPQRTKAAWASEMAPILDTRYAKNAIVPLVCDNLNPHTKGAFDEVCEPARARAYVKRLDCCYTPQQGSWLNGAECAWRCMTRQGLSDRRIAEVPELQSAIMTWSERTHAKPRAVDWQCRIEDARVKLKRLYPKIKV